MATNKLEIPDDWNEADGYTMVWFCIPNSPTWRAIARGLVHRLTRGREWDERTGNIKATQAIGWQIWETLCMANCDDLFNGMAQISTSIDRLTAAITGETYNAAVDPPPVKDYTETGLGPRVDNFSARFRTNNWLAPDENVADVLANSLMGRYTDFPIPFEGEGIADILDDVLTILHNRLRMTDSSVWNPLFGEKNIVEALETLLRRDLITDLEFLTPNVATILEDALNTGDAGVIPMLKNLVNRAVSQLNLPPDVATWLQGQLETNEQLSTAQILLLISMAGGENGSAAIASAIREAQTVVNLNNYQGCCDEADCDCSNAETQTVTVDEGGEDREVNLNGCC